MIFAVVAKATSGKVPANSFYDMLTAQEALDEFCSSLSQQPAAWSAIATGWETYVYPEDGCVWFYDYDSALFISMSDETGDAYDEISFRKTEKIAEIDARTDTLISQGFTFGGMVFSLSLEGQLRVEGMDRLRFDPACSYPISWNTKDDLEHTELADAAQLHAFFMTAVGTLRYRVDSGTALKNAVRSATTLAEIDAVIDTR